MQFSQNGWLGQRLQMKQTLGHKLSQYRRQLDNNPIANLFSSSAYTAVFMTEMQAPNLTPPSIDPVAAQRILTSTTITSAWLQEEVGRRMHDRLQWIRLQPQSWLDWMPLSASLPAHQWVQATYPLANGQFYEPTPQREHLVTQFFQPASLGQRVLNTFRRWIKPSSLAKEPVAWRNQTADESFDMLWANMTLHQSPHPQQWLNTWANALRAHGFLMFSCLGPDSLIELREAFAQQGWPSPTHDFTDMHDWGDMLVQAGFAEPVMDMEKITVTYRQAQDLLQDLREMGRNLSIRRFQGLRGKGWLGQFNQVFERLRQQQGSDKVSLTFEIIYGHAIKSAPKLTVSETTTVSLRQMRDMLHR
jgi:malonyl-CoA O-methyltransferase